MNEITGQMVEVDDSILEALLEAELTLTQSEKRELRATLLKVWPVLTSFNNILIQASSLLNVTPEGRSMVSDLITEVEQILRETK